MLTTSNNIMEYAAEFKIAFKWWDNAMMKVEMEGQKEKS